LTTLPPLLALPFKKRKRLKKKIFEKIPRRIGGDSGRAKRKKHPGGKDGKDLEKKEKLK
jgi:hypothetical protein